MLASRSAITVLKLLPTSAPSLLPACGVRWSARSYTESSTSVMSFLIDSGVMPCALFHASCLARRRLVSSSAYCIESVTLSPYNITRPSTLRAARPIVCTSDVFDRKNPSLSASRIPTKAHSGISSPSRSRLIPIRMSNTPSRRSRMISIRSSVSISECR